MRTAEEIRKNHKFFLSKSVCGGGNPKWICKALEKMINDARKEAIEECAKRATIVDHGIYIVPSDMVDKQSILNLINELK